MSGQWYQDIRSGTIHYLSDGLETRTPPYNKVHTSVFAIIITDRKYREQGEATEAVLETIVMVELATELTSVGASTVDHGSSTMY